MISITNILAYVGEGIRPFREGEQVFLANHVVSCGMVKELIVAFCLQSSKISGTPHRIEITLGTNSDYKSWQCSCSCKAGAGGKCKHVVAVLLYLNQHGNLLDLSCTDVEQLWGKIKKKGPVEVVPLEELCHIKCARNKENAPPFMQEQLLESFNLAVPNSESALHRRQTAHNVIEEDRECDRDIYNMYDYSKTSVLMESLYRLDIPQLRSCCVATYNALYPCEAPELCIQTYKDKELWAQERKFRVTSSRCYSLYTYSLNAWDKKSVNYFFPTHFSNFATEYGIKEEYNAKCVYRNQQLTSSTLIECGLFVAQADPWLGVSPDGVVVENQVPIKILEIKCPVIGIEKPASECLSQLKYLRKVGNDFVLKPRHLYYAQVQLGMCLLNVNTCDFVIYSSYDKSIFIVTVEIDTDFCKSLLTKLKHIFFTFMLHNICKNKK